MNVIDEGHFDRKNHPLPSLCLKPFHQPEAFSVCLLSRAFWSSRQRMLSLYCAAAGGKRGALVTIPHCKPV